MARDRRQMYAWVDKWVDEAPCLGDACPGLRKDCEKTCATYLAWLEKNPRAKED
jgi:hypothetical protein